MPKTHKLSISPTGKIQHIYDDDLIFLQRHGKAITKRASHVEPTASGEWIADMSPSGGPILGPFVLRKDALEAETEWIEREVL